MEFLYLSVLDDGTEFNFVSIDTLTHPIDFIDSVNELMDEHSLVAQTNNLNHTEAYGFFGHEDEVKSYEERLFEEAFGFSAADSFSHNPADIEATDRLDLAQDQNGQHNVFTRLCVPILKEVGSGSNSSFLRVGDEESRYLFFLMTAGDAFSGKAECEIALRQFADAWHEQENPMILKRQMLTKGFLFNLLRGKRIIAPFFNSRDHEWELLLEGARRLRLDNDGTPFVQQTDSVVVGNWTEPDVEQILMDPAYGFGIHFHPREVVAEWNNALLYCCAVSVFIRKWTFEETKNIYLDYLEMLKARFPYDTSDPIIESDQFLKVFSILAERTAESLKGIEESSLTRRFAAEMPGRVYQLAVIASLLQRHLPHDLTLPFQPLPFDRKRYCDLLTRCDAQNASEKGLALEDLAAYLLNAVDGYLLAGRRIKADDCEIDLCYVNASLSQRAWDMGSMLLVECKNRVEVTGVSVVRNLSFIMDAKGCKTGLIVSSSGFTKVAKEQALRLSCQGKTMLLIDDVDLNAIAKGIHPADLINEKYDNLQKEIEDDFGLLC